LIRFENVGKSYGEHQVLADVELEVQQGELVCLIGPSGCGKTTTMKLVNRLIQPTVGRILVDGQDVREHNPVELRRRIGYVIQQIGLFPHMTIAQNISLVPRLLGWKPNRQSERVVELLQMVDLPPEQYAVRFPRELSGGQQQRVGVLRALAAEPSIILMDEPFGALDPITRETLQDELKRLQERLRKTIVFVTHDMDEALKMADRIVVMKDGRIRQVATPEDLLRHPADEFVASFVGRDRMGRAAEDMLVEEIMIKTPVTIAPHAGPAEALAQMKKKRVDSLLVVDVQRKLLGIVTPNDLRPDRPEVRRVDEVMRSDTPTVTAGSCCKDAFEQMFVDRLEHLPVLDAEGRLIGLLTRTSLVDALSQVSWSHVVA